MADFKVRITADQTGVQQAISKVNNSLDSVKRTAASVGTAVKAAMGPLLLIGGAIGGAAAVGGKALLELGGDLQDLSDVTGVAVDQLVILKEAFDSAGMSMEDIQPLLVKMTNTLANPSDKTTKALNDLGLSLTVLKSLSIEEQFKMIGIAIGGLKSPADKITAALAIFGKSGSNLVRLFKDANVFKDAEKNVGGLAARMKELSPSLEGLGDSIGRIKTKLMAFWAELAGGSSGKINALSQAIDEINLTPLAQRIRAELDKLFKDAESSGWGVAIGTMLANIVKSDDMKSAVGLLFEGVIATLKGLLGNTPTEQATNAGVVAGGVLGGVLTWEGLKAGIPKLFGLLTASTPAVAPTITTLGPGMTVASGGSAAVPSLLARAGPIGAIIAAGLATFGATYWASNKFDIGSSIQDFGGSDEIRKQIAQNAENKQDERIRLYKEEQLLKEQDDIYKRQQYEYTQSLKKQVDLGSIVKDYYDKLDAGNSLADIIDKVTGVRGYEMLYQSGIDMQPKEEAMQNMIFDAYKPVVSSLERIGGAAGLSGETLPSLQKIANNFLQQIVKNTNNLVNVQASWA